KRIGKMGRRGTLFFFYNHLRPRITSIGGCFQGIWLRAGPFRDRQDLEGGLYYPCRFIGGYFTSLHQRQALAESIIIPEFCAKGAIHGRGSENLGSLRGQKWYSLTGPVQLPHLF